MDRVYVLTDEMGSYVADEYHAGAAGVPEAVPSPVPSQVEGEAPSAETEGSIDVRAGARVNFDDSDDEWDMEEEAYEPDGASGPFDYCDDFEPPGQAPEDDSSCLLYTSPSPRDGLLSRMPSSA